MVSEQQPREVIDTEKANLRKVGNATVQTIPARWRRLRAFKQFFEGDLELHLCVVDGQKCIVLESRPKEDKP